MGSRIEVLVPSAAPSQGVQETGSEVTPGPTCRCSTRVRTASVHPSEKVNHDKCGHLWLAWGFGKWLRDHLGRLHVIPDGQAPSLSCPSEGRLLIRGMLDKHGMKTQGTETAARGEELDWVLNSCSHSGLALTVTASEEQFRKRDMSLCIFIFFS